MKFSPRTTSRYAFGALITNMLAFFIYCIFQFLYSSKSPVISLISASLCVLPISYLLNRNLVFASTNDKGKEFAKFFGVYFSSIAAASALLLVVLQYVSNPYLAQLINTTCIGLLTFLAHSNRTFMQTFND